MQPSAATQTDGPVEFRPRPTFLLQIAPAVYVTLFGAFTLIRTITGSDHQRSLSTSLTSALIYTAVPLLAQWLLYYRQPWQVRTSSTGLDLRRGQTGDVVHIPWAAVTAVRLRRNRLHVTVQVAAAGPDFDSPWKRATHGDVRPDGRLLVFADLVALRPGRFRLGIELARHLPPQALPGISA